MSHFGYFLIVLFLNCCHLIDGCALVKFIIFKKWYANLGQSMTQQAILLFSAQRLIYHFLICCYILLFLFTSLVLLRVCGACLSTRFCGRWLLRVMSLSKNSVLCWAKESFLGNEMLCVSSLKPTREGEIQNKLFFLRFNLLLIPATPCVRVIYYFEGRRRGDSRVSLCPRLSFVFFAVLLIVSTIENNYLTRTD